MKKIINTDRAPAPVGPYNQAVQFGQYFFISGQIALDPESGELVTGDIESETTRVLENIRAILHKAGLNFEDVIKTTVFVKDMDMYARINAVYASYFESSVAPARELVEVSRLPKSVNIEISVIAGKA